MSEREIQEILPAQEIGKQPKPRKVGFFAGIGRLLTLFGLVVLVYRHIAKQKKK